MTPARVASAALTGLVVGALALVIAGLAALDAVVAGVVAAVLVLVGRSLEAGEEYVWTPVPQQEADGARSAVAALMWSFAGRDGKVSEAAVRALRRQAGRRLAAEGIVLDDGAGPLVATPGPDPAARQRAADLLGERAWAVLTHRGALPPVADVAHCIDAVERLGPVDPAAHHEERP